MKHVIIGCGAAGRAALFQIRKLESGAKVTVISDEADPFYLRPYLGYFLINEKLPEAQNLADEDLRETTGVDFKLGIKVTRVSPKENAIELSDGSTVDYNFLLVATGTRLWPQEIAPEGISYLTLKTRSEALRIKREAERAESVLIYGGGYQALELMRIFHGRIRCQLPDTPLHLLELLADGKQLGWIAGRGFCFLQMLPLTAPDVNRTLGHPKTSLGS